MQIHTSQIPQQQLSSKKETYIGIYDIRMFQGKLQKMMRTEVQYFRVLGGGSAIIPTKLEYEDKWVDVETVEKI